MIHLQFDSYSAQVIEHQETKGRLNTLLGALKSAGASLGTPWEVSYSSEPITKTDLAGVDVFIVLTRDPDGPPYKDHELEAIYEYVGNGGNLLLMTSHSPNFGNDAPLAAKFGITFEHFVSNPTVNGCALNSMVMSGDHLNASLAGDLLYQVDSVVAHDSCEITAPASAVSIATFPSTAVVHGESPAHKDFAILLQKGLPETGLGQVIVTGNSGFIGDYGSCKPGPGLMPLGNNLLFFLNCIRFLTGGPPPAYPGLCPGEPVPKPKT